MGKLLSIAVFLAATSAPAWADLRIKRTITYQKAAVGTRHGPVDDTHDYSCYVREGQVAVHHSDGFVVGRFDESNYREVDHKSKSVAIVDTGDLEADATHRASDLDPKTIVSRRTVRGLEPRIIAGLIAEGARLEITTLETDEQGNRHQSLIRLERWSNNNFSVPGHSARRASGVGASRSLFWDSLFSLGSDLVVDGELERAFGELGQGAPLESSVVIMSIDPKENEDTALKIQFKWLQRVTEISHDPIPDSVFEIPRDYKQIP